MILKLHIILLLINDSITLPKRKLFYYVHISIPAIATWVNLNKKKEEKQLAITF